MKLPSDSGRLQLELVFIIRLGNDTGNDKSRFEATIKKIIAIQNVISLYPSLCIPAECDSQLDGAAESTNKAWKKTQEVVAA